MIEQQPSSLDLTNLDQASAASLLEFIATQGERPVINPKVDSLTDFHHLDLLRRQCREILNLLPQVDPANIVMVDIDANYTFMARGPVPSDGLETTFTVPASAKEDGLPLDQGGRATVRLVNTDSRLETPYAIKDKSTDAHPENHISFARTHFPEHSEAHLFENLTLGTGGEAFVRALDGQLRPYDGALKPADVSQFLKDILIGRIFESAMFEHTELFDTDQTLWPTHGLDRDEDEEILEYLESVQPYDAIYEKGKDENQESYGLFHNNNSEPVETSAGRTVLEDVVGQLADVPKDIGGRRYIVFRALATTHCVFNSARGFRLAQRIGKLKRFEQTMGRDDLIRELAERFDALIKINPDVVEKLRENGEHASLTKGRIVKRLLSMYDERTRDDRFTAPNDISVVVLMDHTDPVRIPSYDPKAMEEKFAAFGIETWTSQRLKH
jgi:hypothetical protein